MTCVIAATQFFQKTNIFIAVQHKGAKGNILFFGAVCTINACIACC